MVPCHNYHIYGMLKKSSIGGGDASHKWGGGALFTGEVDSHCVILLYCETLLQILLGISSKRF